MLAFLSFAFFAAGFALGYWFWIRPILHSRPSCAEFYAQADSFWAAVFAKFDGLKTKLVSAFLMIASGLVGTHDFLVPIVTGIDWQPVIAMIPQWAWPFVLFGVGALFAFLRKLTDQSHARALADAAKE